MTFEKFAQNYNVTLETETNFFDDEYLIISGEEVNKLYADLYDWWAGEEEYDVFFPQPLYTEKQNIHGDVTMIIEEDRFFIKRATI